MNSSLELSRHKVIEQVFTPRHSITSFCLLSRVLVQLVKQEILVLILWFPVFPPVYQVKLISDDSVGMSVDQGAYECMTTTRVSYEQYKGLDLIVFFMACKWLPSDNRDFARISRTTWNITFLQVRFTLTKKNKGKIKCMSTESKGLVRN